MTYDDDVLHPVSQKAPDMPRMASWLVLAIWLMLGATVVAVVAVVWLVTR